MMDEATRAQLIGQIAMACDRDETRRLRYVPCECCGGTGEIICRDGEYRSGWPEPNEYAILCSACEGYGTDCVVTEPVEMNDLDTNQPPIK